MNIDVGDVVGGKYELVRLLGRGAMGEVWVAGHRSLREKVAIKFLLPGGDIEPEAQARHRFLFEAQVAAKLSRKTRHIVSVTDHGEDHEVAYLVMELLEGETLDALLSRAGPRPLPEVVEIVAQTSRALATAHAEGVFHRDLKSANIFISRDEDGRMLVKLLDFGIARSIRGARYTQKGMVLGSPSYMSPEQAFGVGSLDHRCDLWALAVVAYEVHTGDTPFDGETPDELLYNVRTGRFHPLLARGRMSPHSLEQFFARAFAPRIADRFQTAPATAEAFARAAGVEPQPVKYDLPHAAVPAAPPLAPVDGKATTGALEAAMTAALPPVRGRLLVGAGIALVVVALGVTVALRAGVGRATVTSPAASVASAALGATPPPAALSVPPPPPVVASPVAVAPSGLPSAEPPPPSAARATHPHGTRLGQPAVPSPTTTPTPAPPVPATASPAPTPPTSSAPSPKPPSKDEIF